MYLFYNFCTTLHVSSDRFFHHQEFMIYCILQLCTNHSNVSNCSVLRLEGRAVRHVCMACTELQNTVNHELLMMNEMVVRNMYSCTKIVE